MIRSLEHHCVAATFPPELLSARAARNFVLSSLRETGLTDPLVADRLGLVTGELVTNAVLHAGTDVDVRVVVDQDDISLEVVDRCPTKPQLAPPTLTGTSGRGLVLVDALVDAWGVAELAGGLGKVVWVRVNRD